MSRGGDYHLRFRHQLGTDIGPLTFTRNATILQVKERLLQEWPSEGELAKLSPTYISEVLLILGGKFVDNSKTLFDYEREMGDSSPENYCTMHLVIRKTEVTRQKTKWTKTKPECCCMQ